METTNFINKKFLINLLNGMVSSGFERIGKVTDIRYDENGLVVVESTKGKVNLTTYIGDVFLSPDFGRVLMEISSKCLK